MKTFAKPKIISYIFPFIFLFNGCSSHEPHRTIVHMDPSFVQTKLVKGRLGIAGIISIDHQFDRSECAAFANLLYEVLNAEGHIPVAVPIRQVIEPIGNTTHNQIMKEYSEYPTSRLQSLKKVTLKNDDFRYLLLGSIDLNEVEKDQYEEESARDSIHTPFDEDQPKNAEDILAVFETTRTIRVSFQIYDLKNALLAWSCTFEERDSNRRSLVFDNKDKVVEGFAQSLTMGLIQGSYGPILQPKAPNFETLLKRVFISFVDQLP
ncbi:MAG: hypothetical protein JSW04_05340 [Desulfobacterales bacterium]|nr:MAG: hypothetical protein JSW04_05340 [Desulfobacterales bacterium]